MQQTEIERVSQESDVRTLNDLARQRAEIGWRRTPQEPFDFRDRSTSSTRPPDLGSGRIAPVRSNDARQEK